MATVKKGVLVKSRVWAKHLRPDWRRLFWKAHRTAEHDMARNEVEALNDDWPSDQVPLEGRNVPST